MVLRSTSFLCCFTSPSVLSLIQKGKNYINLQHFTIMSRHITQHSTTHHLVVYIKQYQNPVFTAKFINVRLLRQLYLCKLLKVCHFLLRKYIEVRFRKSKGLWRNNGLCSGSHEDGNSCAAFVLLLRHYKLKGHNLLLCGTFSFEYMNGLLFCVIE